MDYSALVYNNFVHAPKSEKGQITVASPGLHLITISYFEKDGGETMQVYWSGPGIERQLIPKSVFSSVGNEIIFPREFSVVATQSEMLAIPKKGEQKITSIYPNPFSESLRVDFNNGSVSNKVSVEVYDSYGRLMYLYNAGILSAGNNTLMLNLAGVRMTKGIYMAKLVINGKVLKTVKLLKGISR